MNALRAAAGLLQRWLLPARPAGLYDRQLVLLALSLMAVGVVIVASASIPEGIALGDDPFMFVKRHALFLVMALGISWFVLQVPMARWQQHNGPMLLLAILMLVLVLLVGRNVNGAVRWLPLGPFNLQPAEFGKLALFVYLAGYLVRRQSEVREAWIGFLKPLAVFGVLAVLLLLQPDLGSTVVMFVTSFGMLFLAGARLGQFLTLIGAGLGSVVMLIIVEPYRMRRVTSFMDPWADPFGSGYQLTQSLMAFGRGSWFGEGLGNSIQKMEYLPEAHTDFVFAILGEELGYVGVLGALFLIFALAVKALKLGHRALVAERLYDGYLAIGIGIWFSFQTFVNVGAASGMMPTKGLTLPLVSYGGSSLIIMSVAVSMLIRIDFELRQATAQARVREV
ncbi:cell division protein FtsW [Aeromonas veronii]|uniref:cell division protein FtsW n=1 Tax=Aeromonas veronii TaxID=654 RepID=UPI00187F7CE3|nr:cell division protein FtsW [Aeromonas veronii]MBE8735189.1 cell division protein FtsW [Aeromonas veronii]MBE8738453.1 cell division protein FtsW [Aeromonas veronii]MBE8744007.1 cell division protein FtsW [Aeromonas veronii]MBE8762888.1 cell division protein FtsW [Aeromonas veronii]MBE8839553.1 cell division protein FtsW [Aeromonas veronii]